MIVLDFMMLTLRRALLVTAILASVFASVGSSETQRSRKQPLPVVWVLATGGTIAGRGTSSTSVSEYKPGTILAEDLVKAVPEIRQCADVKVEQLFNVASNDLTLDSVWYLQSELTLSSRPIRTSLE
jgi:L-asparaginase